MRLDSPPRYDKTLVWDRYTVHDAAGILLRHLKSLPLLSKLRSGAGTEASPLGGVETKLAKDMPPSNRQLLVYMLDTLSVFAFKSDENKMTAVRLVSRFSLRSCLDRRMRWTLRPIASVLA